MAANLCCLLPGAWRKWEHVTDSTVVADHSFVLRKCNRLAMATSGRFEVGGTTCCSPLVRTMHAISLACEVSECPCVFRIHKTDLCEWNNVKAVGIAFGERTERGGPVRRHPLASRRCWHHAVPTAWSCSSAKCVHSNHQFRSSDWKQYMKICFIWSVVSNYDHFVWEPFHYPCG